MLAADATPRKLGPNTKHPPPQRLVNQARTAEEAALLSFSTLKLPFKFCVSLQTKVFAATAINHMVKDAEVMKQLVTARVGPRLCNMVLDAIASSGQGVMLSLLPWLPGVAPHVAVASACTNRPAL